MKKNWSTKIAIVASTALTLSSLAGCGDLVVKVQKKPKDVELKSMDDGDAAANLNGAEDFLKHLDDLKVVAADMLIKQMAKKDYRGEFRAAVRKYRAFLIERASQPIGGDAFYASADECRKTGLSLNVDQANDFLGMILKTAVLAKIGEVSAQKLNPGLSKELAAVSQLIMFELGVKIDGEAAAEEIEGKTVTKGKVTVSLNAIEGELIDGQAISEEMKARDVAEVLTLEFTRSLGEDYVGTFDAQISLGFADGDKTSTATGKLAIERKKIDSRFVHTAIISLGKGGEKASTYARAMTFEQVDGKKHQVKITDVLNYGSDTEQSFATIIDVQKGTQCKLTLDDNGAKPVQPVKPEEPKKDGEEPYTPGDDDEDKKPAPTPSPTTEPAPVTPAKPIDPSKPVVPGTPGQNPGQSPGQSPGQNGGAKV